MENHYTAKYKEGIAGINILEINFVTKFKICTSFFMYTPKIVSTYTRKHIFVFLQCNPIHMVKSTELSIYIKA